MASKKANLGRLRDNILVSAPYCVRKPRRAFKSIRLIKDEKGEIISRANSLLLGYQQVEEKKQREETKKAYEIIMPKEHAEKIRAALASDKSASDAVCDWLTWMGVSFDGAKEKTLEGVYQASNATILACDAYDRAVESAKTSKKKELPDGFKSVDGVRRNFVKGFLNWSYSARKQLVCPTSPTCGRWYVKGHMPETANN